MGLIELNKNYKKIVSIQFHTCLSEEISYL